MTLSRSALLLLAGLLVSGATTAACSKGMRVSVRPPECTVDEKSPDCRTDSRQPSDMTEEPFFKDKVR